MVIHLRLKCLWPLSIVLLTAIFVMNLVRQEVSGSYMYGLGALMTPFKAYDRPPAGPLLPHQIYPVIMFPAPFHNQLRIRRGHGSVPKWMCQKAYDYHNWTTVWFDWHMLFPWNGECYWKMMGMDWDERKAKMVPAQGLEVR